MCANQLELAINFYNIVTFDFCTAHLLNIIYLLYSRKTCLKVCKQNIYFEDNNNCNSVPTHYDVLSK